jgi:ABC-type nitrate/sulfonate/bicarbonate transport system permease component
MSWKRLSWIWRWIVLVASIAGWQLWTSAARSSFFPTPSAIAARMYHLWFSGPASHVFLTADATGNILPSLGRVFAGLAIAVAIGLPLGIALGRSPTVTAYLNPLLQFARALPVVTMAPVFIVLFKLGTQMEIATIAFGTIWPILLNTIDGAASVDPVQLETARAFRLTRWQRLAQLIVPATLPRAFAGFRLSLSLALILMVFAEHRLRDEQRGQLIRHDAAVVDDRAARHPRLPPQRTAGRGRSARPVLAHHPQRTGMTCSM